MEEGQWADVKAFLLHQLGKYAEMLVPPPHKLLLPVRAPRSCTPTPTPPTRVPSPPIIVVGS